MPWWERYPGELSREIQELQAAGMAPKRNEDCFSQGKAVIDIRLRILGRDHEAVIVYPDLYPYFRPMLLVTDLDRSLRHYNPFSGEVCLLQRGTRFWRPELTAAQHILQMLPHWEQAAVRDFLDPRLEHEDKQAEPASAYYSATSGQSVMVDASWRMPSDFHSGTMKLAVRGGRKGLSPAESYVAWVTEFEGLGKEPTLRAADERIREWISAQGHSEFSLPWKRLETIPIGKDQRELVLALLSSNPEVGKQIQRSLAAGKNGVYGFCFPEEDPSGGVRDGWLFLAYRYDRQALRMKRATPMWLIRAEYSGDQDLFQRIPELHPIRQKTVAIVGLGCVGAPSALAFARAGVGELRLLDGDHVSLGTICRWPLGLSAVGIEKVKALTQFIGQNYPLTRIGTQHLVGRNDGGFQIGICDGGYDQWDCLQKLMDGADLVYDATAEQGINVLLADLAAARDIPYIAVSSRAGGWGGDVLRIRPGKTEGCYYCSLAALQTGEIPQPSYDPDGDRLQPVGCGDLTFTAAGFDVEEISLAGVRMAVSTLCDGVSGGYPSMLHDVGILSLRSGGESIFPEWVSRPLLKHPACPRCNK